MCCGGALLPLPRQAVLELTPMLPLLQVDNVALVAQLASLHELEPLWQA